MEILREHEMLSIDGDIGSQTSRENLLDIQDEREAPEGGESPVIRKPRICKPWESKIIAEETPGKGVRGRRRVLYSPPMKRATVPPAVPPKPNQTKPRANSSPVTSPKLVRGTRAMALRQASATAKKEKTTSPLSSPRSLNQSGSSVGSPRSTSSGGSPRSRVSASSPRTESPGSVEKPVLVRQGTFTKDDSPKGKVVSGIPRQASGPTVNLRQASSASLRGTSVNRTPPKIPPKPSMFRRDTVQPSPSPKPLVATTKTQQLREKSLTRGGLRSSNSSTSSITSKASSASKTSIRTSSSSHSLRNAAEGLPRRTPSSSEIERRGYNSRPLSPLQQKFPAAFARPTSPAARSAARPTSPAARATSPAAVEKKPPAPKKDVTSKIASLWKKVEDSKKQKKDNNIKDKRIWISKAKATEPEEAPAPGRLIRSGTYEKLTTDPATTVDGRPSSELRDTKPRSRSRLSIKLSKFGLKRRGTVEDQVNGNTPVSPESDDLANSLASDLISPGDDETSTLAVDPAPKPELRCRSESSESMSTGPDHDGAEKKPPINRSPASAVVQPFNYTPSSAAAAMERIKNAQVKRNSSYVSSMGRRQEESSADPSGGKKGYGNTSSSVVTLV